VESTRPATAGDLDHVVALARAMRAELTEMRGGAVWAQREARPEPLADAYGALLARDDASVVLGLIDDVVVGFGALEVECLRSGNSLGVVTDLFVDLDARAVGVGEGIVGALVDFAVAHRCIGIDAFALPGHRAAKNFFETHGFTARALTMHRRLSTDA